MKYNRIIFDHVPKCAGSFINRFLRTRLCRPCSSDPYYFFRFSNDGKVSWGNRPTKNGQNRIYSKLYNEVADINIPAVFSGHVVFSPKVFSPEEGEFYFTFIRHPIDVFFSDYYYVNSRIRCKPELWSIDRECTQWEINQMRTLSMERYVDWFIDKYEDNIDFYLHHYEYILTGAHDFVGISENMSKSLKRLCNHIGIEYIAGAENERVNSNGIVNTSYRRAELEVVFEEHIECYERIVERFYSDNIS